MLISIVVTSYNYQEYLSDTINSVILQTFKDWEMIVVDDASTDCSVKIIKEFVNNDNRIKLIENKENLGLKKSMQKGVEAASGEWIAFLESDDMWRKDYLEKKTSTINEYQDLGLIFNDVELFGDKHKTELLKPTFERNRKFLNKQKFPKNMFKDLNIQNRVVTFSSVMIKKTALQETNWDVPVDKLLDWWLYIQIAYKNDFFYIPEKLTKWRIHPNSYISQKNAKRFCMVNICAYNEVYKNNKNDKWLNVFIFYSAILFILSKIKHLELYKNLFVRKVQSITQKR